MEIAANQVTSLEASDAVLSYLARNGSSETPDIAFGIGLSPRDVSLAVHDLKKLNYVCTEKITDGRTLKEITRHALLPAADRLTPVMQGAKEKRKVQRNFLAAGHPRLVTKGKNGKGQKHIHGIVGKHDLSKIPKGIPGKIYLAISRPKMSAQLIAKEADLQIQQTWNGLTTLLKLGYIKYEMGPGATKRVRLYSREIDIQNSSLKSPDDIPIGKGRPTKANPYNTPEPPRAEDMAPDDAAPKSVEQIKNFVDQQLEDVSLDDLLDKFDTSDVLLAAVVKMTDENEKLRDLLKKSL